MTFSTYLNEFLFSVYPYLALAILVLACLIRLALGFLIRFDHGSPWTDGSFQLLRKGQLRLGSNLFHYGVLVVVAGHLVGFLTPGWVIRRMLTPDEHQLIAMVAGGIAGTVAFIGLSILLHRRLADPQIRRESRKRDMAVMIMLWLQLTLGLLTVPLSARHMDGAMLGIMTAYVKGVLTFRGDVADLLIGVPWIYRAHIFVGFSILLLSPFTHLVHIWRGVARLAYFVRRPHQIARTLWSVLYEKRAGSSGSERRFTRAELALHTGRDTNRPTLIAYEGKVYDVTSGQNWTGGVHWERPYGGQDLTGRLIYAPHGKWILARVPCVGVLED